MRAAPSNGTASLDAIAKPETRPLDNRLRPLQKREAASTGFRLHHSLATNKDTQTTITGIIAGAVLGVQGLNVEQLIAGDPVQVAHVVSCVLVAGIGLLATKENADGKTTLLGAVAGAMYAMQGSVEAITSGVVIGVLGHMTNKVSVRR